MIEGGSLAEAARFEVGLLVGDRLSKGHPLLLQLMDRQQTTMVHFGS